MAEWLGPHRYGPAGGGAGCGGRQTRPVVTTSFSPPVIQLAEPKKSTSRTTSIPHPFSFLLIRLNFHLTTLSNLE